MEDGVTRMSHADPLFSVEDQVVLVSGGSRGIGRALAEGFYRRGARVVVSSKNPDTLSECFASLEGGAHEAAAMVCDVGDPQAIRDLVAGIRERFGRVDTLINVAGINRRKPITEVTEEDYDAIFDVNLKGAFLLSQEIGRLMAQAGKGSQINITSLNQDRPLKNVAPYAMTKAAMGHMTRSMATEWGARGVRVNAIAPGFILTDLTKTLWSDAGMQDWNRENTPLGRLGQPQDLVGAALFLASAASAFMTGQTLFVDGGFSAGWSWPIPDSIN